MESSVPATAELESAELALSGLRAALKQAREPGAASDASAATAAAAASAAAASTAAAPDADAGPAWSLEEAQKLPKKKTAIFLAYNGDGFSGMQINPDVPTIERSLRDALVLSGGISKDNEDKLSALRWSRAARTDKGVSALGQVVALKLMHPPGLLERLRRSLPEQIKIFGFRKVTSGFDARSQCESRLYEYSFPEWVFDPDVLPAQPGWRPSAHPADAAVLAEGSSEPAAQVISGANGAAALRLRAGYSMTGPPSGSTFMFDAECQERMTSILRQYEGTHNFHNFTPSVCPEQMSAQRNILSFECQGVFTIGSGTCAARWVRMQVHGQSFLLNQIRKMIGLALAVYRGTADPGAVHMALDPSRDFSTPMAPELGLFLCESKFTAYNAHFGKDRELLLLSDWEADVQNFKLTNIYPSFVERDRARKINYQWLQGVNEAQFLFSTWAAAPAVRTLKRPRPREI